MKKTDRLFVIVALALAIESGGVQAGNTITQVVQSPLVGVAGGPAGPRDAKINAKPYCCPSTALEVNAKEVVTENSSQWVEFGFSVPIVRNMKPISGVEVCYEIKSKVPGRTYISETRLTDMTVPNVALVKFDDVTDRKELGPKCYLSKGGFRPKGSVSLALRVIFGNIDDAILIGSTRLLF